MIIAISVLSILLLICIICVCMLNKLVIDLRDDVNNLCKNHHSHRNTMKQLRERINGLYKLMDKED